ncbi:MAG: anhydro-N-acetylmuramic acid kinase [Moheibacter sp.]
MERIMGIGLMSGTSLDGLDICLSEYQFPKPGFNILFAETISYSSKLKQKLKNSISLSGEELCRLDMEYGHFLGKTVKEFIIRNQIPNPEFIASHGHTVFHNPKEGYTVQIGNGTAIFAETGIKTIYDFRTQDVTLGGQGAPLVPIGDELLFGEYDACLNLGGFSNISFNRNGKRIAFDICPVNIVLNRLSEKLGKSFDKDGEIAKSAMVDAKLLEKLDQLEFYRSEPPKSLGIEWCDQFIFQLFDESELFVEDQISTFGFHISNQVSKVLNHYQIKNVLVTGGGAFNSYLIESIGSKTNTKLILPENEMIEFKESLIFGWLGLLRLKGKINILSSVTGASKDHSSGLIAGN